MKYVGIALALSLSFVVPFSGNASAQRGSEDRWVLLGTRNVTDRADHDTVVVTGEQGDFRRIKLAVGRGAVSFQRVVVHFRSGGDQELELRETVRAGRETRAIDLRGGDRVIRSIEFWYEAKTIGRRGSVVRVFGLK